MEDLKLSSQPCLIVCCKKKVKRNLTLIWIANSEKALIEKLSKQIVQKPTNQLRNRNRKYPKSPP